MSCAGTPELSFALHPPIVTLGEPIHLDLEIRNKSEEAVVVDLGHDRKSSLVFTIGTPDGQVIPVGPLSSEGLGRVGRVRLEPGAQHKETYVLNEWYSFRAVGKYSIRPGIKTPVVSESGATVQAEISPVEISLTVQPRDSKKLSEVCEGLLKKLRETSNREEMASASLSLSYVEDPLAVPYIKQGLNEGKLMWQYAIPGLARIADDSAVDLLIEIMKRGDAEKGSALARFHLEALVPKVKPEIREKIVKSLQP